MASFLGAGPAGKALVVLASNATVPVNTTDATPICTPTQACQVLFAVVRTGATAFGATTSFKVGITGALHCCIPTTVCTSLATSASQVVAATGTAGQRVPAGSAIYWSAVQVDGGTATQGSVDLIGYLY